MGLFDRLKKKNLSEKAEELRKSMVELETLKRRSLLDSIEYRRIQEVWAPCQEAIEKGEATESLTALHDKYTKSIVKIKANLAEQAEKQETLRKGITTLLSKNPALLPLLFTDDFMPEGSFNSVLCSLVKGHKEGKVSDEQLKKLTKYKKKNLSEEEPVYVKDNRTQYADTIIIDDENRILFIVRNKNDDFCPAGYCLPGGHIEDGETPREAAQRELKEETGIELELHELVPVGEYVDNKSHIYYFCAHSNVEPVCLQEEEQEQWEKVPYDEIDKKPLIMNLENNLRHLVAIPKAMLNPEADNAQKLYFDGKKFKKGSEDVTFLRSLEGSSAIMKSTGECWIYEQEGDLNEDLEKADRTKLVPKKMFITRGGKTFMTTVWINPKTGEVTEYETGRTPIDDLLAHDVAVGHSVQVRTSRGWREGVVECLVKTKEGAYIGFRTPEGKYSEAYLKSIKDLKVTGEDYLAGKKETEAPKTTSTDVLKERYDYLNSLDSIESFAKLPTLGGSSQTFLFTDADGRKFFLKEERPGKAGQLKSEVLADKVYNAMGFLAPLSVFHNVEDEATGEVRSCKVSEYLEWQELGSVSGSRREKAKEEIRKGFALDCLLANWDVIGASSDNILVSPDGSLVARIDNGSSFQYRAKGSLKTPSDFLASASVVEIDTMRNSSKVADAVRPVYGSLTDEQVAAQIKALHEKRDVLFSTLHDAGASDQVIRAIARRLDWMTDWAKKKEEFVVEKTKWDKEPTDPTMPSMVTEEYFKDWDSFEMKGNPGLKSHLKEGIIAMEKKRQSGYEAAAKSMGMTVGAYKAKLQKLAEDFCAATFPGIVLHTTGYYEAFTKVFRPGGRFKSLFETKTGCGCTDTAVRRRYEHKVFGFVDDSSVNKDKRPIYGCASNNARGYYGESEDERTAGRYGDVFVEVKRDKAVHSATITTSDSLNSEHSYFPVPFGKPHFTMFADCDREGAARVISSIEDYIKGEEHKIVYGQGSYLEMQYHDQLTPTDAEAIHCVLGAGTATDKSISSVVNQLIELAHDPSGVKCKVDLYVK